MKAFKEKTTMTVSIVVMFGNNTAVATWNEDFNMYLTEVFGPGKATLFYPTHPNPYVPMNAPTSFS